ITQNWTLPSNDCYIFTINDDYGDGICCSYGNGFYDIKTTDGTVIISGAQFDATEAKAFTINLLSTNSFAASSDVYLYPNPSSDVVNIAVGNGIGLPDSYTVINYLGQKVAQKAVA